MATISLLQVAAKVDALYAAMALDTTKKWLGLGGVVTPQTPLHILANGVTSAATHPQRNGILVEAEGTSPGARLGLRNASDTAESPNLTLYRSGGTLAAPTAVKLNQSLGALSWNAHNGSGFGGAGTVPTLDAIASQDWTSTKQGSVIRIRNVFKDTNVAKEVIHWDDAGRTVVGSDGVGQGIGDLTVYKPGTNGAESGALSLAGSTGPSWIVLGNSDSLGTAGPSVIGASDRKIYLGVGDSFSSRSGGTVTSVLTMDGALKAVGINTTPASGCQLHVVNPSGNTVALIDAPGTNGGWIRFRNNSNVTLGAVYADNNKNLNLEAGGTTTFATLTSAGVMVVRGGAAVSSNIKGLQFTFDATNNVGYIFSTQNGTANYGLSIGIADSQFYLAPNGNVGLGMTGAAVPANGKLTIDAPGNTHTQLMVRDTRASAQDVGGAISFCGFTNGSQGQNRFVTIAGLKENGTVNDLKGKLRIFVDDGSGSGKTQFSMGSNGWAGFGFDTPAKYGHGGTNKVLQIHNPDNSLNAQAHVICTSGLLTDTPNSSVGSISFALAAADDQKNRIAHIGGVTGPSHTAAVPTGYVAIATKGVNDQTAIGRVFVRETGITDFMYNVAITNPNGKLTVTSQDPNDTGVRLLSIGAAAANQSWQHIYCLSNSNALVFQVYGNGNVQNLNNSYGALSDARYKTNIHNTKSKLSDFMKLRFVNYSLRADPGVKKQLGLISQEVELIFPGMVDEQPVYKTQMDEDGDVKNVATGETVKNLKYSILGLITAKALQEAYTELKAENKDLRDLVQDLLQRVNKLEGNPA